MTDGTNALQSLRVEKHDDVTEVVLLGPGKGNAMGPAFWSELPATMDALSSDRSCRAVILRGEGEHFSFGLDLKAMSADLAPALGGNNLAAERLDLLDLIARLQAAITSVASCRKPVIAAIHGWCIGGGLDLISACDVRYASSDARFSLREIRVAMVADIGSLQRLPAIIGEGHTRELALTGMDIDATRAQRIGLVNDVFDTPALVLEHARKIARSMAENSPLITRGIKHVMNGAQGRTVAESLEHVALWNAAFLQSNDLGEAIAAFIQRRPPRFEGR